MSRYRSIRRRSVEVKVGSVGIGGSNPIRVQSMTTSDTQDVAATVAQSVALAEVGCEIVRVTAPNKEAARCLKEIRRQFSAAGFGHVPLVADIHFLPNAAMEAVEHVEKVRVNPGNYADKKRFSVREYSDSEYNEELQRLHDAFSPLVKRCKELGRSMRIGTNHGSLSDRIMNRYGDTPLGMVESALEFIRIAESHGFHEIILSMKASNPKVMIQAYRLLVDRMDAAHQPYPLHLGVTEAGDGEDGRIKSAIGIGSLLLDGLGDTIRVSLTEDSVYEIPVARALATKAMALWSRDDMAERPNGETDGIDPFHFSRRENALVDLAAKVRAGGTEPPRVIVPALGLPGLASAAGATEQRLAEFGPKLLDTPPEGLLLRVDHPSELADLPRFAGLSRSGVATLVLQVADSFPLEAIRLAARPAGLGLAYLRRFELGEVTQLGAFVDACRQAEALPFIETSAEALESLAPAVKGSHAVLTLTPSVFAGSEHPVGAWRRFAESAMQSGLNLPLWLRSTPETSVAFENSFLSRLLEGSLLAGSLLCDGLGDLVSLETETDPVRSARLAYNILQGAGARISKTEFVACPSCGRTLFDLQSTTQRIREKTGHLKGVKIAIMGCIVNGPGEMADADFGYVGGAPGKINLYVGKNCVQYNIPQAEADARLVDLIKERGKWVEPDLVSVSAS
jgi:(E)-4-hydroxy-3-methylbut-2-enyl-diphosphate synthase